MLACKVLASLLACPHLLSAASWLYCTCQEDAGEPPGQSQKDGGDQDESALRNSQAKSEKRDNSKASSKDSEESNGSKSSESSDGQSSDSSASEEGKEEEAKPVVKETAAATASSPNYVMSGAAVSSPLDTNTLVVLHKMESSGSPLLARIALLIRGNAKDLVIKFNRNKDKLVCFPP